MNKIHFFKIWSKYVLEKPTITNNIKIQTKNCKNRIINCNSNALNYQDNENQLVNTLYDKKENYLYNNNTL